MVIPAALLLFGAVFAAVHHAEIIALRVGEPFGSIILAVAVTVIEVALIVSIMLAARGRRRHDGAGYRVRGGDARAERRGRTVPRVRRRAASRTKLPGTRRGGGVERDLGTLAVIALILPNYTRSLPGPFYAPAQLLFVGFVSLCLYCVFLFVQTVRHRDYFITRSRAGHRGRSRGLETVGTDHRDQRRSC